MIFLLDLLDNRLAMLRRDSTEAKVTDMWHRHPNCRCSIHKIEFTSHTEFVAPRHMHVVVHECSMPVKRQDIGRQRSTFIPWGGSKHFLSLWVPSAERQCAARVNVACYMLPRWNCAFRLKRKCLNYLRQDYTNDDIYGCAIHRKPLLCKLSASIKITHKLNCVAS